MLSNWILRLLARFRSEEGQALAEYGLIVALIAVICIATLGAVGVAIPATWTRSPRLCPADSATAPRRGPT